MGLVLLSGVACTPWEELRLGPKDFLEEEDMVSSPLRRTNSVYHDIEVTRHLQNSSTITLSQIGRSPSTRVCLLAGRSRDNHIAQSNGVQKTEWSPMTVCLNSQFCQCILSVSQRFCRSLQYTGNLLANDSTTPPAEASNWVKVTVPPANKKRVI